MPSKKKTAQRSSTAMTVRRTPKAKGRQAVVPLTGHEKMMLALYRALPSARRAVDQMLSASWRGVDRDAPDAVLPEMNKLRMDYCSGNVLIYFVNVCDADWRKRNAAALDGER